MKTTAIWLTSVIILSLAAGLLAYSFDTWSEDQARIESREAALSITRDTLSRWTTEALLEKGDTLFLEQVPEPNLRLYVASLQRLGTLQDVTVQSAGLQWIPFWVWNREVRAELVLLAWFNDAPTSVEISMVRRGGQWLVSDFLVQASFMPA